MCIDWKNHTFPPSINFFFLNTSPYDKVAYLQITAHVLLCLQKEHSLMDYCDKICLFFCLIQTGISHNTHNPHPFSSFHATQQAYGFFLLSDISTILVTILSFYMVNYSHVLSIV